MASSMKNSLASNLQVAGMDAVFVAVVLCMEARQAAVNSVVELLFGSGGGCIRAVGLVASVAVSLPLSRLQADAPTLPNRFFVSRC